MGRWGREEKRRGCREATWATLYLHGTALPTGHQLQTDPLNNLQLPSYTYDIPSFIRPPKWVTHVQRWGRQIPTTTCAEKYEQSGSTAPGHQTPRSVVPGNKASKAFNGLQLCHQTALEIGFSFSMEPQKTCPGLAREYRTLVRPGIEKVGYENANL